MSLEQKEYPSLSVPKENFIRAGARRLSRVFKQILGKTEKITTATQPINPEPEPLEYVPYKEIKPIPDAAFYSLIVQPETFGIAAESIAEVPEDEFMERASKVRVQLLGSNPDWFGVTSVSNSTDEKPGIYSENPSTGRFYFIPKSPDVVYDLLDLLDSIDMDPPNNMPFKYALKVFRNGRVDKVCVYYPIFQRIRDFGLRPLGEEEIPPQPELEKNEIAILTAMSDLYLKHQADIIPFEHPFTAVPEIIDKPGQYMTGISFKQAHFFGTPNSTIARHMQFCYEFTGEVDWESVGKSMATTSNYNYDNPAFLTNRHANTFSYTQRHSHPSRLPTIDILQELSKYDYSDIV